MKPSVRLSTGIALAILTHSGPCAEEPSLEIAGLQQAAADFVTAYNDKDAAALAALFTEDGDPGLDFKKG